MERGLDEDEREPDAAWHADLPKTPDYRDHKTYAALPAGLVPSLYLVVASARSDFRACSRIQAARGSAETE